MASPRKKPNRLQPKREFAAAVVEHAPDPVAMVAIDYTRLQAISRLVVLEKIDLVNAGFTSLIDPREVVLRGDVHSVYTDRIVDARWHRNGTKFEVVLGYELVGQRHTNDEKHLPQVLFRLGTTWVVTYRLPTDFERPENYEEAAADFVIANGQVNVAPFLRQHVVDVTAKAGWPPLVLPVFRVPKNRQVGLVQNCPAWRSEA